ncbi:MAG: peptidase [Clostridia bacterium]|nr:peptidase [Clostridia bacterium]
MAVTAITGARISLSENLFESNSSTEKSTIQSYSLEDFETELISLDTAKQTALTDAGISADDVTYTNGQLDYDNGVQVYDIDFYTASTDYEYEIDASTGSIISKSSEASEITRTTDAQAPVQSTYIGIDKAKNLAVSHAGLNLADVIFQKAKLENDDGRAEYEIEFYANGTEYEYAVHAENGTILEYDSETND